MKMQRARSEVGDKEIRKKNEQINIGDNNGNTEKCYAVIMLCDTSCDGKGTPDTVIQYNKCDAIRDWRASHLFFTLLFSDDLFDFRQHITNIPT